MGNKQRELLRGNIKVVLKHLARKTIFNRKLVAFEVNEI